MRAFERTITCGGRAVGVMGFCQSDEGSGNWMVENWHEGVTQWFYFADHDHKHEAFSDYARYMNSHFGKCEFGPARHNIDR